MSRSHDHWLMKPGEASQFGINPKSLEKLYPFLLHVVLPRGHRLLVRDYMEAFAKFMRGKEKTSTLKLAEQFADSKQAAQIGKDVQLRYAEIVEVLAKQREHNGLNAVDIAWTLGVDVKVAYGLRSEKVLAASRSRHGVGYGSKLIDPDQLLALCPMKGPGCP